MSPAPHLVQALQDTRELAADQGERPAGWKALRAQTDRVLERLPADAPDPDFADESEMEGPVGDALDPDTVDLAVASLTALQEQPDEEQLEIALSALTDLEDALPGAPGPGSHPGR